MELGKDNLHILTRIWRRTRRGRCFYDGENVTIGSYSYLLDVFGALRGDTITMELSDEYGPTVIIPIELMPFLSYANAYLIDVHLRTFACKHFQSRAGEHSRMLVSIYSKGETVRERPTFWRPWFTRLIQSFRDAKNSQLISLATRCEITARVERKDVLREISMRLG